MGRAKPRALGFALARGAANFRLGAVHGSYGKNRPGPHEKGFFAFQPPFFAKKLSAGTFRVRARGKTGHCRQKGHGGPAVSLGGRQARNNVPGDFGPCKVWGGAGGAASIQFPGHLVRFLGYPGPEAWRARKKGLFLFQTEGGSKSKAGKKPGKWGGAGGTGKRFRVD